MDIIKLDYPDYLDKLKSLVNLQGTQGSSLEVGTGFLKAGIKCQTMANQLIPGMKFQLSWKVNWKPLLVEKPKP